MSILQNSIRDDGEQCCEEAYNRLLAYRKENHIYPFDDECSSSNNSSSGHHVECRVSYGRIMEYRKEHHLYPFNDNRKFCSYCGQLLSTGSGCLVPYAKIKDVLLCSECYCKILIKPKED